MKKITPALVLILLAFGCATKTISIEAPQSFTPALAGAPETASAEDMKDYQTLLQLQKTRTKADCARGASEVDINLSTFFGPAYGPLTSAEVAKWSKAFDEFSDLAWPLVGAAKAQWQRPRPFVTHSDLNPCAKREKSFSYPSGHASMAHYYMHILTELKPEKKSEFEARADQIAFDRNIVGVHYPSDIRDGKRLGDQIYDYLKKSHKFQEIMARAKSQTN